MRKYFLPAVFLAALLVRLAYALNLDPAKMSPDAYGWMAPAWALASGAGFTDTYHPPGYIAWLAAVFFVFGKSVAAARVMNAILGALTCVLLFFIGKKAYNETTGGIASVLLCFYPYSIAYSGDLISETFLMFMIAVSVLLILAAAEDRSFPVAAAAGVSMGAAALTKSVVLPFFALALVWLFWTGRDLKQVLVIALFAALAVMPWTLRNYYTQRTVAPVSTPWLSFAGSNCDEAYALEALGELDKPMPDSLALKYRPKVFDEVEALSPEKRDEVCRARALGWVKDNPAKFAKSVTRRFLHFWRLYPVMAYSWQKAAALLTSGLYILLAAAGLFFSRGYMKKASLFLLLFFAYTAVYLMFVVVLRYRIPIDPYIIVMASFTIERLIKHESTARKPAVGN